MAKRSRNRLDEGDDPGSEHRSRSRKKPRAKAQGDVVHAGSLSRFQDFSLDVWYEVFYHSEASDLVNLAQTNRRFRTVLLDRSADSCWKAALANVEGLPERPQDLSAPAYAHLMFSPHCHACGKARCYDIFWDCRARYCRKCRALLLLKKSAWPGIKQVLQGIDFKVSKTPLGTMIPLLTQRYIPANHRVPTGVPECRASDVEELVNTLVQLDEEGRQQLIATRQRCMAEWRERPYIWHDWGKNQKRLKIKAEQEKVRQENEAIAQLKQQRVANIIERTKALGWTDILNKMSHTQAAYFHAEPAMQIAKPFGDKWKIVRPKVVRRMKQIERTQEWSVYMHRLKDLDEIMLPMRPFHPRYPTVVEVSRAIPEVRELMTSRLDEYFCLDDYDVLKPLLSAYLNSRHEQLTTSLSNLVKKTLRIEDEDIEDPLSLAAAFFRCEWCTDMTAGDDEDDYFRVWRAFQGHFSECIAHVGHLVDWRDDAIRRHEQEVCDPEGRNNGVDLYEQALSRCLAARTPNHHDMHDAFTAWGIRWASNVIKICGQDPRTVTPAEMDSLDILLVCDSCRCHFDIPVMTWRGALDHWKDCRRPADKLKLRVASEHETAAAQPLIQKALAQDLHYKETSNLWGCSRCLKWGPNAYERTKSHVMQEHGLVDQPSDWIYTLPSLRLEHPIATLITSRQLTVGLQKALRDGTAAFYTGEGH